MSKLPLVDGVLKYVDKGDISLSMPGHKGGLGFSETIEGKRILKKLIKCDVTEVDGLDNLHHPQGIIQEAQELLRKLYGSNKSYFLVNGSTSGNLAMIFSSFNEGDKIIVERNCHRSIFNGIIMRKLKPIYIKSEINSKYNAPLSIDMEHFLYCIKENKDAKGIIITYPNYYGVCADLSTVVKEAKRFNMKVLVDSAHGAHFGANSKLPKSAVELGADMVVMSSHKTLPSLTQTAYLHVMSTANIEKVDFYVSAFTSTSPSYLLMCSMDYARFFLDTKGKEAYGKLLIITERYKQMINKIKGLHVIGEEDINADKEDIKLRIDGSRYILNIEKGYSGHKLFQYLNNNGFTAEMSDNSNVILIFSPFNIEEDFQKLYETLKVCNLQQLEDGYKGRISFELPEVELLPYEVMDKGKKRVRLKDSLGNISSANIIPYPPGIPLIMMGEIMDENSVNMIQYYLDNQVTVIGTYYKKDIEEYFVDIVSDY